MAAQHPASILVAFQPLRAAGFSSASDAASRLATRSKDNDVVEDVVMADACALEEAKGCCVWCYDDIDLVCTEVP